MGTSTQATSSTATRRRRSGTLWIGKRYVIADWTRAISLNELPYEFPVLVLQELVKVRGFQVSPSELEAVLLSHPDIVDCAVLGVRLAANSQDEIIRAYVVRRQGTRLGQDEVKQFIRNILASYKALTGGVVFLDEIPKSPSGKILKRVLKEQAELEQKARPRL